MPWGGAGGKKLGHLKMCYTAFPFMLTPSKDIISEISRGAWWLSGRVSDSGARGGGSIPTAAVLCP